MAIFATIFGALGRFAGKLLTAVLGWASTLLFGRVPQDKQVLLLLMTFGSVVWVVLVVGVIVPEAGTLLLGFVPIPDFVDENLVRLGMLIGALVVPLLIGLAATLIQPAGKRPKGLDLVKGILRGYPLAFVLALVLVFLAGVATVRKIRALLKRWKDAHVPVVVREGGYERMVRDLEEAIDDGGIDVTPGSAPPILILPAQILATVAGSGVRSLVPDRLVQLTGPDLEIQLYPSDVAIAGKEVLVNRARAALASRLASTSAFMTTSAEAQALEEEIQAVADRERLDEHAQAALAAVDGHLSTIEIQYEEWEVLYRQRLQVERDLLTGRKPGAGPTDQPGSYQAPQPVPGQTPAPIDSVVAAGIVGLLVLDVLLALWERFRR
ncbi:MAG TPA: hypothetical protein VM344_05105 [Vitreimonas sp.]|nr:hypothetical protein [Vitreimonas sp.]